MARTPALPEGFPHVPKDGFRLSRCYRAYVRVLKEIGAFLEYARDEKSEPVRFAVADMAMRLRAGSPIPSTDIVERDEADLVVLSASRRGGAASEFLRQQRVRKQETPTRRKKARPKAS